MPEPEDNDSHMERRVVYETVSTNSTKYSGVTIAIIAVVAIALVIWIVTLMR
jgi:hypothetical protein